MVAIALPLGDRFLSGLRHRSAVDQSWRQGFLV